jgi:hypothetical protein
VATVLLLDVTVAFDNVSHVRLLHNLGNMADWILSLSFLSDRRTIISLPEFTSDTFKKGTGIP